MIKMSDMMLTFNRGKQHGLSIFNSSSLERHLRPFNHDHSVVDELRFNCLHFVGGRLDKSSNISYIRTIRIPSGKNQGEK